MFLANHCFWVCEKSDGIRVLLLIVVPISGIQEVYLVCCSIHMLMIQIDRRNMFFRVDNICFPQFRPNSMNATCCYGLLTDTLLDGELVVDKIGPNQTKLKLLLFDCLVMDRVKVINYGLQRRLASIDGELIPSYLKFLKTYPDAEMNLPFEIQLKDMVYSYNLGAVLSKLDKLKHENDGLIFTSMSDPYTFGTTQQILKWKPPHENTVDFKIELRFPSKMIDGSKSSTPDYAVKPTFQLFQHVKGDEYEAFDWLDMSDSEWESWKEADVQLDNSIVECAWHAPSPTDELEPTWHIKRIRNDKSTANHKSTVKRIIKSIKDGVEENEVCSYRSSLTLQLVQLCPAIRAAWKTPKRIQAREETSFVKLPFNKFPCKGRGGPARPKTRGGKPGTVLR